MDNIIYCDCGSKVFKHKYNRHSKTKKHLDFSNKQKTNDEANLEKPVIEKNDIEKNDIEKNDIDEDNTATESIIQSEEELEEEEIQVKPVQKNVGKSKEYLDIIRQKAVMTIKQKNRKK